MKFNLKNIVYVLICAIIMFLPRRWFILGIQSYRIVCILLLILLSKKIKVNTKFMNVFTMTYIFYIAGYYLIDNGFMSFLGFLMDTLGVFIIVYSSINNKEDINQFLSIFVKCITIYSIFCIIQTFTEFNIFDVIAGNKPTVAYTSVYYRFGFVRSYGSFTMPINNAVFLSLGSLIILYEIENSKGESQKNKLYVSFVCVCFAIASTLSRSPMIFLGIVLILYWMKKGIFRIIIKNINKILMIFLILVVVFLTFPRIREVANNFVNMFLAIVDDSARNSISDSFGTNVNGVGERGLLYKWVSEEIQDNPFLGVGPDNGTTFMYRDANNKVHYKTSIENQYLKMLCYFGWSGLVIFVVFTIYMFVFNYKLYCKTKSTNFYFFSLLMQLYYILIMFCVASIDDMRMYFLLLSLLFLNNKFETEKINEGN